MEIWYRKHITKNLLELVHSTICNVEMVTSLRAKDVLSDADVETLNTYRNQLERSSKFYDIILKRFGIYDTLKHTLLDTNQSGAYSILNTCGTFGSHNNHGQIKYDRKTVIGKGCYHTKVYKGEHDGRPVAVKWISCDFIDVESSVREINLLRDMDHHDNVVRYYASEVHEEFVLIALELCDLNLNDFVVRGSNLNISPLSILQQLTSALAHLHAQGIVHRDMKPENVLLVAKADGTATVKLSDFGLSRKSVDGTYSVSIHSSRLGTEGWIAPEVLPLTVTGDNTAAKKYSTAAADVFSLGCIFYFVMTVGSHPFGAIVHRQSNIVTYKLDVSYAHLKYSVKRFLPFVLQMLAKDSCKRPTALEVLQHDIISTSYFWSKAVYTADDDSILHEQMTKISVPDQPTAFSENTVNIKQSQSRATQPEPYLQRKNMEIIPSSRSLTDGWAFPVTPGISSWFYPQNVVTTQRRNYKRPTHGMGVKQKTVKSKAVKPKGGTVKKPCKGAAATKNTVKKKTVKPKPVKPKSRTAKKSSKGVATTKKTGKKKTIKPKAATTKGRPKKGR